MDDILINMRREHDFLVCVDSDGCAFDTMSLKQEKCFYTATEEIWELKAVSRYARETALFVNLYSATRGINRYPALVRTLRLLAKRPEAVALGYRCPDLSPLEKWIDTTSSLSLGALEAYMRSLDHDEPVLEKTVRWVQKVDGNIRRLVQDLPPFDHVREALERFSAFADIVVVSTATHEDLTREWGDHGLLRYVSAVAGQELGPKALCIQKANSGHYPEDHTLMIGDSPADYQAARKAGALFYPILAGREAESWKYACTDISDAFRNGVYAGSKMESALAVFNQQLLKDPPWAELRS